MVGQAAPESMQSMLELAGIAEDAYAEVAPARLVEAARRR